MANVIVGKVSISSPSGEGGETLGLFIIRSRLRKVSISSPSGEGGEYFYFRFCSAHSKCFH